jgi:hypothetical protein
MKKIIIIFMALFFNGFAIAAPLLPKQATLNFVLNHTERGDSCPYLVQNARVVINYDYDFERNMGLAFLKQLQDTDWTEVLHPLGLSSMYGFMSDMAPKTIHLNGGDVIVYRIIFNLRFNGDSELMLMIGEHGDCVLGSDIINVNR